MAEIVPLAHRGVLRLSGPDVRAFLQGVLSNDVEKATQEQAIWAAFLTPQGKYLHDFFLVAQDGDLLLEGELERLPDLMKRLKIFKLRAKAEIAGPLEGFAVAVVHGEGSLAALDLPERPGAARAFEGGVAFVDPRLAEAGARLLLPSEALAAAGERLGLQSGAEEGYERRRIALGLPDGSRDMQVEKAILLECGFDELGGVDWDKGCYMGQELTARTKYRGLIKKRLMPLAFEGEAPAPGTPVMVGERQVGELRTTVGALGIALLRLEHAEAELEAAGVAAKPALPAWLKLPEKAET